MRKNKLALLALASVVSAPLAAGLTVNKATAASFTDVTVALTNEAVSSTTGVNLTFSPVSVMNTGTEFTVTYDTDFTGTILAGDISVVNDDPDFTSATVGTVGNGYFTFTITTAGTINESFSVVIDNSPGLTTPATPGNYSWSISADINGLGTSFDTGSGLASVGNADNINVVALVSPILEMELYVTDSDTLLADPNTCNLGALAINAVNTCEYDVAYATNSDLGLTVKVNSDGALRSGSNSIGNVAGGNVDAATSEYGFRIDSGAGCGTVTSSYAHASNEFVVPTSETALLSNDDTCNGTTAGQSAKRATVTHVAAIDGSVPSGTYNQLVTYTAYSN